ncbi:MAG TPA: hypothetical protein VMI75_05525 [Polyangiaceae bacterium]|nr:hypothetical protein [Polyangiaceae bacterium]
MKTTALACTLAAFALVAACGGGGEATPPPATPAPSATEAPSAAPSAAATETAAPAASAAPSASAAPATAAPPAPGPGDWDKWSHEQKLAWMKAAVMPKMKDLFSSFDSAKYGDMKCKTCHGHGAEDGSFKMPNPDLPKLPKTPDGFKKLAKDKGKIMQFMKEQVLPTMAGLVGEQPYDPKANSGFGCMECHTQK